MAHVCERQPLINSNANACQISCDEYTLTAPKRALVNVITISFSFFLFLIGAGALVNLQSTMNAKQGMGPDSEAAISLCSLASCFFSQILIEKYGAKNTFLFALLIRCLYIAANFCLRWDVLMTTSVLYGFACGPLNAAMSIYINEMATRYKTSTAGSEENIKAFFFGLSVFFAQISKVFGNVVSYCVLNKSYNSTDNYNTSGECGSDFSPGLATGNTTYIIPPSQEERTTLVAVYLLLGFLGVACAYFLEPLRNDVRQIRDIRQTLSETLMSATAQLKNPHQLLLIPLTVFCGIEAAFYSNEFTEAYIACSWGIQHVGFVSICYGACGAVMSLLVGLAVKCIGHVTVIGLSALVSATTSSFLFVWTPSPAVPAAYFIFAGVWGVTDAIWWSQISALYSLMFSTNKEAAFSNFYFWSFLGYFLSYAYANYIVVALKIIVMMSFLLIGITLYIIGQIKMNYFPTRSGYVRMSESE